MEMEKDYIDRETRSSLFKVDLKEDKLYNSGKLVDGNEFHS